MLDASVKLLKSVSEDVSLPVSFIAFAAITIISCLVMFVRGSKEPLAAGYKAMSTLMAIGIDLYLTTWH